MSLGSSNMAGGALGKAFSLLLLASIIQGLPDVQVLHYEKVEAAAGQNVTLRCTVKGKSDLKIVSVEWSKNRNESTKLALYSRGYGFNVFWPNVTMQIDNTSMTSYLQLYRVAKRDSGFYICDISSFPLGSIRRETELQIKDDVNIMCDVDGAIDVPAGANVTIWCRAFPDARYMWTKNNRLVSENESLDLCYVTDAHTGVYTLTVSAGNKRLHKEFIVTVQTPTTSLKTDPVTVSPQSNVTEEGLIESTDGSLTASTADATETLTVSTNTDATDHPNYGNVTAAEATATHSTHISATTSHTDPDRFTTAREINHTRGFNTSPHQSVSSDLTTTLSYEAFRSTRETKDESTGGNPGAIPTLSAGNTSNVLEDEDTGVVRRHLLLVLIIIPILILIAMAGFLYRRHIMKQRMDLPPPFKPPPPPVKYTAARRREISTPPFTTSRCNSLTEFTDMKQMFINI